MKTERTPRLPWVVLGVMTTLTFGGPLLIGAVLRGGERTTWPPDRAVEWATLIGTSLAVVVLMACALGMALANNRRPRDNPPSRRSGGPAT